MSSVGPSASDYFGGMVESYDSLIRRAVPRYDEMTQRLLEYLPAAPERILELGCGTGNLTLRLAAQFPHAQITAVDASPEMTTLTAARLKRTSTPERVRTITARFEDVDLPASSCDLVASCMSLHHVRDIGTLYRAIHRWLAPGGALRVADMLRGATDEIHTVHWAAWLEFCRRPGHCTAEELQGLVDHAAAHDHYVPLEEHFALLRAAGFTACDCVWRNGMYSVVTAERA